MFVPTRRSFVRGALALGLSAAALLPTAAVVGPAASAQEIVRMDPISVETGRADQAYPRASGDWVVWEDFRRSTTPSLGRDADEATNRLADIRARNLVTGEEHRLTETPNAMRPAISGNIVVWAEVGSSGDRDLVVYDLAGRGTLSQIRHGGNQDNPAVSGSRVVWQDDRDGTWDIRGFDVGLNEEFSIMGANGHQTQPAIDGALVAWRDSREGGRICFEDLSAATEQCVPGVDEAFEPSVQGTRIAFRAGGTRNDPEDAGIYLFNVADQTLAQVSTTTGGERGNPVLSETLVTWWDEREGDRDIFAYNLATGAEFKVNAYSAQSDDQDQDMPTVSGSTVLWTDRRHNDPDIRGVRIVFAQTPQAPAAQPIEEPAVAPDAVPEVEAES